MLLGVRVVRYADCPAMLGAGNPAGCTRCDSPLEGLRRVWCSDECMSWFQVNHAWSFARPAALARDGQRCCRCGRSIWGLVLVALLAAQAAGVDPLVYRQRDRTLDRLGVRPGAPDAARAWARTLRLEVNHIEPRRGEGYEAGCHNHLENLETLCHDCHADTTAAQQGYRRRRPTSAQLALT